MRSIRRALLVLIFPAVAAAGPAQTRTTAPAFADLAVLDLAAEGVRIRYPAERATRPAAGAAYLQSYAEAGARASQPLRLDLGHGLPPATLTCDSGPADDPTCRLLADAEDPRSTIFEASGKEFVFLRNGEVYAFGRSDSMYDRRRLFRPERGRYVEAAQAFRYVGIEGRTSAPLVLTDRRGGDRVLLTLEAGSAVTILLNAVDGDDMHGHNPDYLVKTPEGLVGWARLPRQPDGRTIVEGLQFDGA